jgi:hypothetical protein
VVSGRITPTLPPVPALLLLVLLLLVPPPAAAVDVLVFFLLELQPVTMSATATPMATMLIPRLRMRYALRVGVRAAEEL